MPLPVERVCAEALSRVSRDYMSIRYHLERMRPRAPRGLLTALCLGTLRNYKLLAWMLRGCGAAVEAPPRGRRQWLLLVAAYEAVFRRHLGLEKIEAATGAPRSLLQCLRSTSPEDAVSGLSGLERLSVLYSQPLWVVEKLAEAEPPGGLEALLQSFQEPTPVWLRYNRSRLTAAEAVELLLRSGVEAAADPVLDDVLEVLRAEPGALPRLPRSLFYPQDRAAALAAHLLSNTSPEPALLLDTFSAPGNKLAHAYWRLGPLHGVAVDLSHRRMGEERRLHLDQEVLLVDYVAGDARQLPVRGGAAPAAIVDPDCTSMGRLGHSPETRLFLEATGPGILQRLVKLQKRSAAEAARALRRGGVLVYTTCTLTLEENEGVVSYLVEEHGLEPVRDAEPLLGVPGRVPGSQRLYPHLTRSTGGFAAVLAKT